VFIMSRRIDSVLSDPRFRREVVEADLAPADAMADFSAGPPGVARDVAMPRPPIQEAVVLLHGRPSLLIRKNRFELPRSGAWAEALSAHRALIEARLPSVGRIEVDDGAGYRHSGTGWVIADGVIATNRHVAEGFARKRGDGGEFLMTFLGSPYQARIDFREEYEEETPFEIPIEEIVFLEDADRALPDIALLRLARHGDLPEPIPLLETPPRPQADIAVVGYPAFDPRYGLEAEEAARAVFGKVYDVKRLSPGSMVGEGGTSWFFSHDATTLGGNSGSVVLDVETGYAVGMHFSGSFLESNYAVRASALLDRAARHAVSVVKREKLPPVPKEAAPDVVEEAPPQTYADRKGYQKGFLGARRSVPLPVVGKAQKPFVLRFTDPATGKETDTLNYTHFSVVMNAGRRLCFYSAVNLDGKTAVAVKGKRPGWRLDSRIPAESQIIKECYGAETDGKFSRGHMTRREDPNWGEDAIKANADTFHATNAVPQIQPFNAGVWLSLEDYALENADQDDMRISVFTGPIFRDDDPEFFGVQVPIRFWKVIVFIHDETRKLCATGYIMSQKDLLPGEEFVFGRFQTYQTRLAEIEGLTGLSFGPLTALDPMRIVEEAPPVPLRGLAEIRFA
jgi:endonuclease G